MVNCRFCETSLTHEFVDLIHSPPSNSFLKASQLTEPEIYYPLKLFVCEKCLLVQIDEHKAANEIFNSDYVYFSSYSKSWLDHCQRYAKDMISRFKLNESSSVMEVASNDGYLLQFFKEHGVKVLGIEPTKSTADVAISRGIDTTIQFFGVGSAQKILTERGPADLMAANNVLAHVPNLNDFVGGFKILLAKSGVLTVEFPHLLQMVKLKQFDTIYHEHFSYFSLTTICKIFAKHGLRVFDVEEIPTHGGSLRIYVDHGSSHALSSNVEKILKKEFDHGMTSLDFYKGYQAQTDQVKNRFLSFILSAHAEGKKIVAYGAAAKGNTFLNYCGVKKDLIQFVVDASPHKQGRFLPGSHIPVLNELALIEQKPDYVVILPWNLKDEITRQLEYIRKWGAHFVIAIPELQVF